MRARCQVVVQEGPRDEPEQSEVECVEQLQNEVLVYAALRSLQGSVVPLLFAHG